MIEGASPYKVFGRKKRSKCFKPKPRRVSWQSQSVGPEHATHRPADPHKEQRVKLDAPLNEILSHDVDRSK